MPKRSKSNVYDLKTGKRIETTQPIEEKKPKRSKSTASIGANDHQWEFKPRFRKGAFGWKSQPAIKRIKEAVSEIKKVARKDTALASEGAVLLIEKISPALEHVDSSSGAIGAAVNNTLEVLASIIESAEVDCSTREVWLDRLWKAMEADQMPYIERLGDLWGDLCETSELADRWANRLIDDSRQYLLTEKGSYYHGTGPCLSALLRAERYDDIFELLECDRYRIWHYQQFGVRALEKLGRINEAVELAESCAPAYGVSDWIMGTCEQLLLDAGFEERAYANYGIKANQRNSYLSTYRAIAKKYPTISSERILNDLIATTPGEEGKWFATAKELKMLELAEALALKGPCEPKTLTKAAKDYLEIEPRFSLNIGLASIDWLLRGYGYEVESVDVWAAYRATMKAADILGLADETRSKIIESVLPKLKRRSEVARILAGELCLNLKSDESS